MDEHSKETVQVFFDYVNPQRFAPLCDCMRRCEVHDLHVYRFHELDIGLECILLAVVHLSVIFLYNTNRIDLVQHAQHESVVVEFL